VSATAGQVTEPVDALHAHLDMCTQCREQPFNLCATGAKALAESMAKLHEALDERASKYVPPGGWIPPGRR
jgi:anti-sigma factor ChrR (cupin superfamily)